MTDKTATVREVLEDVVADVLLDFDVLLDCGHSEDDGSVTEQIASAVVDVVAGLLGSESTWCKEHVTDEFRAGFTAGIEHAKNLLKDGGGTEEPINTAGRK